MFPASETDAPESSDALARDDVVSAAFAGPLPRHGRAGRVSAPGGEREVPAVAFRADGDRCSVRVGAVDYGPSKVSPLRAIISSVVPEDGGSFTIIAPFMPVTSGSET